VRKHPSILASAAGVVGAVLVGVGVVYVTVACQDLPGILGPTPGDTSPRTALGVVGIVLGLGSLGVAFAWVRRP